MRNCGRLYPRQLIIAASSNPQILNPTFTFFDLPDFHQNIIPLHAPVNMYNCNVQVRQHPCTMSTAPVKKNHEPFTKRRIVIHSSDYSQ